MTPRLSIRWKLILSTFTPAVAVACGLIVLLNVRTHAQLLGHLEKTLETKCDEVLSVFAGGGSALTLDALFAIETNYRFSPYTYFYQVTDGQGRVLAVSRNLGERTLPVPGELMRERESGRVLVEDGGYPGTGREGEVIRIRSERLSEATTPWGKEPVLVQVAVSLWPLRATMRRHVELAALYGLGGLTAVFLLLWSVITRVLRPVARMTKRASAITATNLRERLPLSGAKDELDQLADMLNGMLDRLQQSLCQMEEFTSDAAHQLRTPLTRIRGELDIILRNGVPPGLRGQLERVQEELERLSRMCGRLLLLARLDQEARESHLLSERVDMEAVVAELVDQMTPLAHDKGVRLVCGAMSHAVARGNKQLIVEALLNLLHNAMRFAGEGGTVEVSLATGRDGVTVAVRDSGPGIPHDEHEKIFRRFYGTANGAGDSGDGVGLGLAIVSGIARAHGGAVDVVSAPGEGSCFRLSLPAGAPA